MLSRLIDPAIVHTYLILRLGRDSSVGIATLYWLDGMGIESRWGQDFLYPSSPGLEPTQLLVQRVTSLFPGVKRRARGVNYPSQLQPRLNKEYSYTSPPLLKIHGTFYGKIHIFF